MAERSEVISEVEPSSAAEAVAQDTQDTQSNESSSLKRRKSNGEKKSRKPPGNKWLQQQMPACRPVFSAKHIFVVFVIAGLIFVALGILFTVVSMRIREMEVDYTSCAPIDEGISNDTCEDYVQSLAGLSNFERTFRGTPDCHCQVNFTLEQSLRPPYYVYYSIRNYYQNHRRYLNSLDVDQLRGEDLRSPSGDCRPLRFFNSTVNNSDGLDLPVMPCGLIANSWFNDSFDTFTLMDSDSDNVTCCDRTDIAWQTDRSVRFRNPGREEEVAPGTLNGTTMPPFWLQSLADIDGGLQNETLMVWFRVSAFPWFRKLYGRLSVAGEVGGELPAGNYSMVLTYNYPVAAFSGRKALVLAEVSWLGGRNLFLGVAYIVVGSLLIITAVVLLLVHLLCSKWKTSHKDFLNRRY